MKTNRNQEQINPDDIEREASKSGRHWKEVLREQLKIVGDVQESIARKQKQAQERLFEGVAELPVGAPNDGLTNRDHDKILTSNK